MRSSMYPLTVAQEDVAQTASTALDTIRQVRNEGVAVTVAELRAGHSFIAQARFKQAVERQAGIAGCGAVRLPSAPRHYDVPDHCEVWAWRTFEVLAHRNDLSGIWVDVDPAAIARSTS